MTDLGDITVGIGFIANTASLTAALLQAEQLATQRPVLIHVGLDPAQVQAQLAKMQSGLLGGAPIKIGLDTTAIQAALHGVGQAAQTAAQETTTAFQASDKAGMNSAVNVCD
jgi:hypothetical protein